MRKQIGHYRITREIGQGGMATLYHATDTRTGQEVAIKVLLMRDPVLVRRFQKEREVVQHLRHPNIATLLGLGEEEGQPYLVMPYAAQGSLDQHLQPYKARKTPMTVEEVTAILRPVAAALDYAHSQNILHRDIKPPNVLIDEDGQVLLADFGIAKRLDIEQTANLTGTGNTIGTFAYMSPEQAEGDRDLTVASDIYSLGVMAYEMLTNQLPFSATSPTKLLQKIIDEPPVAPETVNPALLPGVTFALRRALAKDAEKRYPSASALIDALEHGLTWTPRPRDWATLTTGSHPAAAPRSRILSGASDASDAPDKRAAEAPAKRSYWAGLLVGLLGLLAVSFAGYSIWTQQQGGVPAPETVAVLPTDTPPPSPTDTATVNTADSEVQIATQVVVANPATNHSQDSVTPTATLAPAAVVSATEQAAAAPVTSTPVPTLTNSPTPLATATPTVNTAATLSAQSATQQAILSVAQTATALAIWNAAVAQTATAVAQTATALAQIPPTATNTTQPTDTFTPTPPAPQPPQSPAEVAHAYYAAINHGVLTGDYQPAYLLLSHNFQAKRSYADFHAGFATTRQVIVEEITPLGETATNASLRAVFVAIDEIKGKMKSVRYRVDWQLIIEAGAWRLDQGEVKKLAEDVVSVEPTPTPPTGDILLAELTSAAQFQAGFTQYKAVFYIPNNQWGYGMNEGSISGDQILKLQGQSILRVALRNECSWTIDDSSGNPPYTLPGVKAPINIEKIVWPVKQITVQCGPSSASSGTKSEPVPIDTPNLEIATAISSAPVIDDAVLRIENNTDGKLLHQDLYFHDGDGDAYLVAYELISSTRAGIRVENDDITAASTNQMAGAMVTGTWQCNTGGYVVVLRATIFDKAGNRSNPRNITFDCQ